MSLFPSRQVAVEVLGFSVYWYGLMYLLAFLIAYVLTFRLQKFRDLHLSKEDIGEILSWGVGGVIIGGRLGYVLFYEPAYFFAHPMEILFVWNGGMASHGGFIGVALALWYILRKKQIPLLRFLDVVAMPVALGLACGRLGNFINWELYGTVTDVPWAVDIPGVEGLRHPTFFYAMAKDLWIALASLIILRMKTLKPGSVIGAFLLMYGILRFLIENYREQPHSLIDIGFTELSRGQLLTIPIIALGAGLLWNLSRR